MDISIDMKPSDFIDAHVSEVKPIALESHIASWDAALSGKSEDYDRSSKLNLAIRTIYSDPKEFAYLKAKRQVGKFSDKLVARQVDRLYYWYLTNQMDEDLLKETVELSSDIRERFSTFRGTIDGKEVTGNDILSVLKDETNNDKRKQAWLASKQVGVAVAEDIIRLVKLRNKVAINAGFENFHTMSLTSAEQNVAELDKLFGELDELTAEPFAKIKSELDVMLAGLYGVEPSSIKPWHYHDPFFQVGPMVKDIDLDVYYKGKDIKALSAKFYDSIGLNVDVILENSDLYERKDKYPSAFCKDIDKDGDVRILCNIQDTEYWMTVQLHELGHAVYSKYHDKDVPYLLRNPAHIFTTEAIAMMFGRLSRDTVWMQDMLGLSDAERDRVEAVAGYQRRLGQLVFARWAILMYNFEKQLYANPDQNLNVLWWDMVEKYQLVKRPAGRDEPDWASKIHFAIAPCYYHNYLLGEMLASQLHHDMAEKVAGMKTDRGISYVGSLGVGEYLRRNIFEPGSVYQYNEMIKNATGEYLTPKYFVDDFVK